MSAKLSSEAETHTPVSELSSTVHLNHAAAAAQSSANETRMQHSVQAAQHKHQPAIGSSLILTHFPLTVDERAKLEDETVSAEERAALQHRFTPHAVHFGHEVMRLPSRIE